jgi:hypothetical protein
MQGLQRLQTGGFGGLGGARLFPEQTISTSINTFTISSIKIDTVCLQKCFGCQNDHAIEYYNSMLS